MNINEELIRDALLRSSPEDLEEVLTTIEAYRMCSVTARRLTRSCGTDEQRAQALECVGYCRKTLEDYAATGRIGEPRSPLSGEARFVFAVQW
jgi:hypothetical protein